MAVLFAEDFAGGTDGANVTTGNTSFGSVNGTPKFSDDQALTDTLSMLTSNGQRGHAVLPDMTTTPVRYIRAYVWAETYYQGSTAEFLAMGPLAATGNRPRIGIKQSGAVVAMRNWTIQSTSSVVLATGAWNRIEHRIEGTTSHQVRVFVGANCHGTTPDWDSGTLAGGGNLADTDYLFGGSGSPIPAMYWDALAVRDDDWVGPISLGPTPVEIPAAPSNRAPYAAVLTTPDGPQVITSLVSSPSFKSVSPGGYASVEFDLPRSLDAPVFPPDTEVAVYLTTTGEQVAGGRLLETGRNDDGTWHMSFLGTGLAALQDIDEPYMVIDSAPTVTTQKQVVGHKIKRVSRIKRKRKKPKNGTITWAESKNFKQTTGIGYGKSEHASAPNATEEEGLLFSIPKGIDVTALAEVRAEFRTPALCGQLLGAYGYRYICSLASTAWRLHGVPITVGSSFVTDRNDDWATSLTSMTWRNRSHFGDTRNALALRILRGTNLTTGADTWAHVRELIIRTQMYDRDGNVRTGAAVSSATVKGHEVFADIVQRRCGSSMAIRDMAEGDYDFRQLAWYEGVTAKDVLDEICEADGKLLYHAWGKDVDGKTVIDLDVAPTVVRYELSTKHGFNAPTPASEYYNRVVVIGKVNGQDSRYVLDRSNGGTVRSFTLDLDGDFGNGNAAAAAEVFLDANQAPPNSGTITVVGHVLDLWTGRWVHHSQILPGQLCRVRGVQPQPDALNPEAKQDGVTIFRIASNSVSADAGTATLELDTPVLDTDRAIADLIGA